MPRSIPSFIDSAETFKADACAPLIQAATRNQLCLHSVSHGHYPGESLRPGVLPGLKMAGFWDADREQDWGLNWHRNEGIEFTFLENGSIGFGVDNVAYELHPKDLTITRPWQKHRVGSPHVAASRLYWVIIDIGVRRPHQEWDWPGWVLLSETDLSNLTNLLRENEQPVWKANTDVQRCFHSIGVAIQEHSESQLAVRVNELLLLILGSFQQKQIRRDSTLTTARRTVRMFLDEISSAENLAIDWNLDQMATQCGLASTQFFHHVKALTNMAPLHYLNHCRLNFAAKLLRENADISILDTAMACGFCSSQYFATLFSRKFGCSPSQYRSNLKDQLTNAAK
jgi:AraC-like DNA-binding protein